MWDMSLWKSGSIGDYWYEAKVYGAPSDYGVTGFGCISKLGIRKGGKCGKELYHWPRGLRADSEKVQLSPANRGPPGQPGFASFR